MSWSDDICKGSGVADQVKIDDTYHHFKLSGVMFLFTVVILIFYALAHLLKIGLYQGAPEIGTRFAQSLVAIAITICFVLDVLKMDDATILWGLIYIVIWIILLIVIYKISPLKTSLFFTIISFAYTLYLYLSICTPTCTEIKDDEDECNGIGKICSNDTNGSDSECGSCSNSEKVTEEDCSGETEGEKDVWTSQLSSCYWVKPQKDVSGAPKGSCIYDLNKCAQIDCNTFEATYLFGDCCMPDNWEKWMDEKTLKIIQEQNKKDGSGGTVDRISTADLAAEYNLRKASSEEYSRREEMDQGLYA